MVTVRHVWRSLSQDRATVVIAILIAALGLGVSTAVFGVMDALLLRMPAGIQRVSEVQRAFILRPPRAGSEFVNAPFVSHLDLDDLAEALSDTDRIAGYAVRSVLIEIGGAVRHARVGIVTGDYFALLGVRSKRGHLLDPSSESTEGCGVVVSERLWGELVSENRESGAVRVGGRLLPISAVAAAPFRGADLIPLDAWIGLADAAALGLLPPLHHREAGYLAVLVRSSTGETSRVVARLSTAVRNLDEIYGVGGVDAERRVTVADLRHGSIESDSQVRGQLVAALAAVGCAVLVLACGNLVCVQVLRAQRREQELGTRIALERVMN